MSSPPSPRPEAAPPGAAGSDLAYIRDVVARTDRRVDPHAFHYVHWGTIVLVWYPLSNWFELRGDLWSMLWVGIAAGLTGALLSLLREMRLHRHPRLVGENTFLSRQMQLVTFLCIGAGSILSSVAPSTGFVAGHDIPTLWGLVYATMAAMLGVIYRRAFLVAGCFIFAGVVAAMVWPAWNGYLLGPAMGLGMIVPGLQAERRVKRLRAET
jgi:hypothetical protein